MLIEKKTGESALSVVRNDDVKVIEMKPARVTRDKRKKSTKLSPPQDQFNTGYIKSKKHDPL